MTERNVPYSCPIFDGAAHPPQLPHRGRGQEGAGIGHTPSDLRFYLPHRAMGQLGAAVTATCPLCPPPYQGAEGGAGRGADPEMARCSTCGGTPELDPMVASWSPDGIAHIGACPDRHPPTAWGDWYRHLEAQGATP